MQIFIQLAKFCKFLFNQPFFLSFYTLHLVNCKRLPIVFIQHYVCHMELNLLVFNFTSTISLPLTYTTSPFRTMIKARTYRKMCKENWWHKESCTMKTLNRRTVLDTFFERLVFLLFLIINLRLLLQVFNCLAQFTIGRL